VDDVPHRVLGGFHDGFGERRVRVHGRRDVLEGRAHLDFEGRPVVSHDILDRSSCRLTSRLYQNGTQHVVMSLTTEDFAEFLDSDPEDDESVPLGDALDELAVDVEVDAVDAVREERERL
jgi:hypothetical protein